MLARRFDIIRNSLFLLLSLLAGAAPAQCQETLARFDTGKLKILVMGGEKLFTVAVTPKPGQSAPALAPEVFAVENPSRLVIDIPGFELGMESKAELNHRYFSSVRLGKHPKKTRLVLDIRDFRTPVYEVTNEARLKAAFIDIAFPETPPAPAAATVTAGAEQAQPQEPAAAPDASGSSVPVEPQEKAKTPDAVETPDIAEQERQFAALAVDSTAETISDAQDPKLFEYGDFPEQSFAFPAAEAVHFSMPYEPIVTPSPAHLRAYQAAEAKKKQSQKEAAPVVEAAAQPLFEERLSDRDLSEEKAPEVREAGAWEQEEPALQSAALQEKTKESAPMQLAMNTEPEAPEAVRGQTQDAAASAAKPSRAAVMKEKLLILAGKIRSKFDQNSEPAKSDAQSPSLVEEMESIPAPAEREIAPSRKGAENLKSSTGNKEPSGRAVIGEDFADEAPAALVKNDRAAGNAGTGEPKMHVVKALPRQKMNQIGETISLNPQARASLISSILDDGSVSAEDDSEYGLGSLENQDRGAPGKLTQLSPRPKKLAKAAPAAPAAGNGKPGIDLGNGIVINEQGVITNAGRAAGAETGLPDRIHLGQVRAINFTSARGGSFSSIMVEGSGMTDHSLVEAGPGQYLLTINKVALVDDSLSKPAEVPGSVVGFTGLNAQQAGDKVVVQVSVEEGVKLAASLKNERLWLKAAR